MYATIAISGLEEAQNNGKEQVLSLLEAKVMQAEETLKNRLSKQLYGTQPAPDPTKDFLSLDAVIDSTGAIGGIDPAVAGNAWWKAIETAVGTVDGTGLERAMSAAYHTSSDSGSDRVDAIFTGQGVYEFYESTLTPQVRYTDTKSANLGFMNLLFKQTPVYWDFDCPPTSCTGSTRSTSASCSTASGTSLRPRSPRVCPSRSPRPTPRPVWPRPSTPGTASSRRTAT